MAKNNALNMGVVAGGGETYTFPSTTDTLVGRDSTDTLTNKRLTSPKLNEDVAITATATEVNVLDGITATTTELNYTDGVTSAIQTQLDAKRPLAPRVSSETSSATPTINTDNVDAHSITALATAITSFTSNLSGTPTNFQKLVIRIKDNGTARAITWGASFEAKGVELPTTTVISKVLTVGFIYDTITSKWGCVAVAQEE